MKELPGDFADRYGPRALILGGSEGIGAAFAEGLAAAGLDLTLVARSAQALEETAAAIRRSHGVDVEMIQLDLTRADIEARAGEIVAARDYGLIIYNAGATHGVGLFLDQPVDHALNLVRLNCAAPIAFAHHGLAAMRSRGRGGLLIVSSMSGMVGSGYVAAYAASKSFEIVLAEGLHWELARDGVDVTCAVATLTDTPAMRRSGMVEIEGLVPMDAGAFAMNALDALGTAPVWYAVGEAVVEAMRAAPRTAATAHASAMSAQLWGMDADPDTAGR
ncbi:SDR family NAD(P)-dependent oxidoreductase [Sphingobium sp. CAP-1]|uniref:SDR family NAD(P)-dependent oxidoreductase n=1 Tax=Sphingobium sp. CAP-1 TaxID=2676077 RepID=UPI0012BB38D2|nr:SDR family NAD(P)-dependent oxidoreductase [Sphingobium sp. CAP-1]QGP79424.1 SDR family NAD(P)-dependent oxidoreductase [Sphingobium sp. CAP-1]